MTHEEVLEYQAIRASLWLPNISDQDALVEAQALVNLLLITVQ